MSLIFIGLVGVVQESSWGQEPAVFSAVSAEIKRALAEQVPPVTEQSNLITQIDHVKLNTEYVMEQAIRPFLANGNVNPILFNLFDNVALPVVTNRMVGISPERVNWTGRIRGFEDSQAVFLVKDGKISGDIRIPGRVYQIRPAGAGVYTVRALDPSQFPDEQPPLEEFRDKNLLPIRRGAGGLPDQTLPWPRTFPSSEALCMEDTSPSIDVLVGFTPAVRAAFPNPAWTVENEIEFAIVQVNDTYERSGIHLRLRLVHTTEVNYTESGDWENDLLNLEVPGDGFLDDLLELRDVFNADLVSLWVEYPESDPEICEVREGETEPTDARCFCGKSWKMETPDPSFAEFAFSAIKWSCATASFSFAHELGHNMGAWHDRESDRIRASNLNHHFGHVNVSEHKRTIMATKAYCGIRQCDRISNWSNPNNSYPDGQPMGVPQGQPLAADNRKTLNANANIVANFRMSGVPAGCGYLDLMLPNFVPLTTPP